MQFTTALNALTNTPRPVQTQVLQKIERIWEHNPACRIVLELPTGGGKSLVAASILKALGDGIVVTIQKTLQDQYINDFNWIKKCIGRANFDCHKSLKKEQYSCGEALCVSETDMAKCPYKHHLHECLQAKYVAHNVDSLFFQRDWRHLEKSVVILDEAHNLENKFMGYVGFTLSEQIYPHVVTIDSIEKFVAQSNDIHTSIAKKIKELQDDTATQTKKLRALTTQIRNLKTLADKVDYVVREAQKEDPQEFVLQLNRGKEKSLSVLPIRVDTYMADYFWSWTLMQSKVLMMSATILNHALFCTNLGLNPTEVAFIQEESPFDLKGRAPIVYRGCGKMSYEHRQKTYPNVIKAIRQVLDTHTHRGVIHTHSDALAQYLETHLQDARLIFKHAYPSITDALTELDHREGGVLVGSALGQGLDFKDDLARWQMLLKVPFGDLSSIQIQRRKETDEAWYLYNTVLSLIQLCGRIMRSAEDYGTTYITDSSFCYLFHTAKEYFPAYFVASIRSEEW